MKFAFQDDVVNRLIASHAGKDLITAVDELNASWVDLSACLSEFVDVAAVAENIQMALDIVDTSGMNLETYAILNRNHELADLLNLTDSELLAKFTTAGCESNFLYRWYKTDVSNAFVKAWDALVEFIRRIWDRVVGFFKTLFAKEAACVVEFDKKIRRARTDKNLFNPLAVHPTGLVLSKNAIEVLSLATATTPEFVDVADRIVQYYTKTCGSITDLIKQSNGITEFGKKCFNSLGKANASFNKLGYAITFDEEELRLRIVKSGRPTLVDEPTSEDKFQLIWKTEDTSKTAQDTGWSVDIYTKYLLKAAEFTRYSSRSIFDFQQKANKLQKDVDGLTRAMNSGSATMGDAQKEVVKNVRRLHVFLGSFLGIFGDSSNKFTSAFMGLAARMDSTFFGRRN